MFDSEIQAFLAVRSEVGKREGEEEGSHELPLLRELLEKVANRIEGNDRPQAPFDRQKI